jgi:hypothetical protein
MTTSQSWNGDYGADSSAIILILMLFKTYSTDRSGVAIVFILTSPALLTCSG